MRQTLKENHLLWEMRKIDIFSHPSTRTTKWSPIRLILVTYQPETSWVISTRAKHKPETLTEGPQTVIVVFAMRNEHRVNGGCFTSLLWTFDGLQNGIFCPLFAWIDSCIRVKKLYTGYNINMFSKWLKLDICWFEYSTSKIQVWNAVEKLPCKSWMLINNGSMSMEFWIYSLVDLKRKCWEKCSCNVKTV